MVLVRNTCAVNPVQFDPVNVGLFIEVVLTASDPASAVTTIEMSAAVAVPAEVLIDNPVTAAPVVALATGVMFTLPLEILDEEMIPVPVTFTKVTLLVVATA